jgi:Protein of unknown function (DUF1552)
MKKLAISRRAYLKTFAGLSAVAAAQFSGLLRNAWAADPSRLRLLVITQPHANTKYWAPRMPGGALATHGQTGWTLDFDPGVTDLKPMEKHKDSLVIVDGLDFCCTFKAGSTGSLGHQSSIGAITGSDLKTTEDRRPRGPSIDIALASFLKVEPKVFKFYAAMNSHDAAGNAYGVVGVPYDNFTAVSKAYKELFSTLSTGATPDPKAAARLAAERQVLKYLNDEAKILRGRLATAEKLKLDQHLETLSLMEQKLVPKTPGLSCTKPTAPPGPDDDRNVTEVDRYAFANTALATIFACDMTRVATFHMNSQSMNWLELNGSPLSKEERGDVHNNIAHMMKASDDTSIRKVALVHNFYAAQVSALCDLLKAIDDGDGKTVYDNTIILWTNELGDPVNHLPYNVPFVLAGGGGSWQKGRYLSYGRDKTNPHNGLLVSVLNQFGMNASSFGDPEIKGELVDL